MNFPGCFKVLIVAVLLVSRVSAQVGTTSFDFSNKTRTCLTRVPPAAWDSWFNTKVNEKKMQASALKQQVTSYTIPVIVHVLHAGEAEGTGANISQAQVNSQINTLNADFAGNGYNVGNLPSPFQVDKANCSIIFSMAQLDPHGKALPEPGIDRVDWHLLGKGNNPLQPANSPSFQAFFDDSIKPKTIWDPRLYFNIWISDVAGSVDLLGYATFPGGTGMAGIFPGTTGGATDDGVWIWSGAFGTIGSLHPKYNKGRTATHEIGHWLGLRHLWGDTSCGDDFCDDTPKQQTSNLNCPSYPKANCGSTPNGEMFMNFMDYCDDPCIYMFTWDQMSRMHIAMENGTYRKLLSSSSQTLCNLAAQQPVSVFSAPDSACANAPVEFGNSSAGMPGPVYTWDVSPNEDYMIFPSPNAEKPLIIFTQPGSFVVTLTASNETGVSTSTAQVEVKDCGLPAGITEHPRSLGCVIFPNPSSGEILVTGDFRPGADVSIEISDAFGAIVLKGNYSPGAIHLQLGELPAGVYFAGIRQENQFQVRKLVLVR